MSEGTEKSNRLAAEIRNEALRRDRRVKIGLLAASLLTIALLAVAALRENILAPWRLYQKQYARILATRAVDERGRSLSRDFRVEMKQTVLPELGTDRSVRLLSQRDRRSRAWPVSRIRTRSHPGHYLEWHEVGRFGCTVCHRGQGRAMDFKDAKAEGRHWDYPLLPTELTPVLVRALSLRARGRRTRRRGLRCRAPPSSRSRGAGPVTSWAGVGATSARRSTTRG